MKGKVWLKVTSIIVVSIICIFLTGLLAFNLVYIKSKVSGGSMLPTLHETDRIFINRFNEGKNGDIVVANISKEENWTNKEDGDYVIKTLVAKAGDKVKIERVDTFNYELLVNDIVVDKKELTVSVNSYYHFSTYVAENILNTDRIEDGAIKVLDGEVFIVGDNWEVSYDCFSCGPISEDSIVGRVDIVVPKKQNIVIGAIKGIFKLWF